MRRKRTATSGDPVLPYRQPLARRIWFMGQASRGGINTTWGRYVSGRISASAWGRKWLQQLVFTESISIN